MNHDELMTILKKDICDISFEKVDGTVRNMRCTLKEDLLPKMEDDGIQKNGMNPKKPVNTNVIPVWDLEINAWRSFRVASLLEIQPVLV